MGFCGIFNTAAGVIAFLVSTYEVRIVRPAVWPEIEDNIPPKETEMEARFMPSRSLGPFPFSDPEPTPSLNYTSFQHAVDTRPDFPLELSTTGYVPPHLQFPQSAPIPAVPPMRIVNYGVRLQPQNPNFGTGRWVQYSKR